MQMHALVAALLGCSSFHSGINHNIKRDRTILMGDRESFVRPLRTAEITEQKPQGPHTTKNTHLAKIAWKSQIMWLQPLTNKYLQPLRNERIRFPQIPHYNIQNVKFSKKNYRTYKKTGKYSPFTGEKVFDRNHP